MPRTGVLGVALSALVALSLGGEALAQSPGAAPAQEKRIRGTILRAQGDEATIDVGREQGVKERTVYDVFTEARAYKLPMTNETVYVPQRVVGQLVIVDVDAKTAQAKLMALNANEPAPKVAQGALVVSNPFVAPRNLAPYLKALAADPAKTDFGRPVQVKLTFADEKEDLVSFDWSANGGSLSHARSALPAVTWTPPLVAQPTTFKVSVTATDTSGNRSVASVDIVSGPPPAGMKTVYEARRVLADHTKCYRVAKDIAFDDDDNAYILDSDSYQVIGMSPAWSETLRTEDRTQPYKYLDRIHVRAGEAFFTDLEGKRAIRLKINPKMYQESPATSYGKEGTGNGEFQMPVDIAVDQRGEVYVLDQARGCVQIFALEGQFVGSIGSLGTGAGQLQRPTALALSHDGTLFVLDDGRKRVLVYKDRRLALEFEAGAQAEQLLDLKVDRLSGRVCVLEGTTGQIRSYTPDGKPREAPFGIAAKGDVLPMGSMVRPTRLKFDRTGGLHVIAADGKVIHRFDPQQGAEVARWGGIDFSRATKIAAAPSGDLAVLLPGLYVVANLDRRGWTKGICGGEGKAIGKLSKPAAVAVDEQGNVCVLDAGQGNVQVFDPRGRPIKALGQPGKNPTGMRAPLDLAVDPTRRYLAVLEDEDDFEVKLFDLKASAGAELRGSFPGNEDTIESPFCVGVGNGAVMVAQKNGDVKVFTPQKGFDPKQSAAVDTAGGNSYSGASWKLSDDVTKPSSLCLTNMNLLFVAVPGEGLVQVVNLAGGARTVITRIKDPKVVKSPTVASVDDFDRVFIWDAGAGRALEMGR